MIYIVLFWLREIALFILILIFMFLPLTVGLILAHLVNQQFIFLIAFSAITVPVGVYWLFKMKEEISLDE